MAVPTTAIQRTELGSTFNEFDLAMSRGGFIGQRVLRPRMSATQSAAVPLIPLEEQLQQQKTQRAAGARYQRGQFEWTNYSFATKEYGWEEPIDDRTLAIYRDLIEAEAIHASRCQDFVMREYETKVVATVYDTAVWTGAALTTPVGVKWNVPATAVPITNVFAGIDKVKASGGHKPNGLTMNDSQLRDVIRTAQVVDQLKFWGGDDPKNITPVMLAELFQLEFLLVANFSLKNTANPSAAGVIADIWDSTMVMLGRFAVTDDPAETCIGRTIMFSEESAGPGTDEPIAVTMEEYRDEPVRGSVMRSRTDYDLVVIFKECGHLLTNIR